MWNDFVLQNVQWITAHVDYMDNIEKQPALLDWCNKNNDVKGGLLLDFFLTGYIIQLFV